MKIAILRALQIGDLLCTVPAFRALKQAYPKSELSLIGLPWSQFLVDRSPYLDRLIPFPGLPGLPEVPFNPQRVLRFIEQMQEEKFDLILQIQGNGSIVNPFIELFSAKKTAGFYRVEDYTPNFNVTVEYPNFGSEVHRMLSLIMGMAIPLKGDYLEYPLIDSDYEEIEQFIDKKEKYICIHSGARDKKRRWPPHLFAQVADYCSKKGCKVILTGTKEEIPTVEKIIKKMKTKAINLAGKTSLGSIGALIDGSKLLISGDTGVVHIASALKKPTLTISQNSDPERWTPLNTVIHHSIEWNWNSTIDEVFSEIELMLSGNVLDSTYAEYYRLTR